MIDPERITNYNLDKYGLQENILFWILVAEKTAKTMKTSLENFLNNLPKKNKLPFEKIKLLSEGEIIRNLKKQ